MVDGWWTGGGRVVDRWWIGKTVKPQPSKIIDTVSYALKMGVRRVFVVYFRS